MSKIGRSETFPNNRSSAHVSKPGLLGKLKRRFRLSSNNKGKYDIAECSESGSLSSIDSASENGNCVMTRTSSLDCSDSLSSNGNSSLDEAVQMRHPSKGTRTGSSAEACVEKRYPEEVRRRSCEETHVTKKATPPKRFSENIYRASLELISEKPMEKLKIMEQHDICNDFLEADENAIDLDDELSYNASYVHVNSHKNAAPQLQKQDSYLLSESLDDPGYESLEKIREQVSRKSAAAAAAQNYGTSSIYSDIDKDGNLVCDSDERFPNKENLVSKSSIDSGLESANQSMSSNEICQQFDEINASVLNGDQTSSETSYRHDSRKSSEDLSIQISNLDTVIPKKASSHLEEDPEEIYSNYRVPIRKQMMSQNLESAPMPLNTTESLVTPQSESSHLSDLSKPYFDFKQTLICADHSDLQTLSQSLEFDESRLTNDLFDSPPPVPERKYSRIDLDESNTLNVNGDLSSSSDTSFSRQQCSIIESDKLFQQTCGLDINQSNNHLSVCERLSNNTSSGKENDCQCSCSCHGLCEDETKDTEAQLPDSGNNVDNHETYQSNINNHESDKEKQDKDSFKLQTKHSMAEINSSEQCLQIDLLSTVSTAEDNVILVQGHSTIAELPPKNVILSGNLDTLPTAVEENSGSVGSHNVVPDVELVYSVTEERNKHSNVILSKNSKIDVELMSCDSNNSLCASQESLSSSAKTAHCIDNSSMSQEQCPDDKKRVQIISDDKMMSMVLISTPQNIAPSLREIVEDNDDSSDAFSGSVTPLSENDFLSNEESDFVTDLNPQIISKCNDSILALNYDGNDYVDLPSKQTATSESLIVNSCSSSVTLLPDCGNIILDDLTVHTPGCSNLLDSQTRNIGLCLAEVESQPSCSSASIFTPNSFYTENENHHDTFVITNFMHDADSGVPTFCEPESTSNDEPVHMSLAELFDSSHPIRVQAREAVTEKGHRSSDRPKSEASSHIRAFKDSMQQLKECGWYWGPLSFEEAEMKLSNKPDGSFLVRDSSNENYILSLSFKSQDIVHHTRIEHFKGKFGFWSQPESHAKSTIKEFIELAMQYSRNGNFKYFLRAQGPGLPPISMHLLYPVSRFRQMRSLQHMCRFSILQLVRRDHIEKLPVPKRIRRYLRHPQYYVETIDQEMDDIVGFPNEDHNQNLT